MKPGAGAAGIGGWLLCLAAAAHLAGLAGAVRAPVAPARRLLRGGVELGTHPAATSADVSFIGQRGPGGNGTDGNTSFDLVEKQSVISTKTLKCLCDEGHFWNFHTKACVKQGGWGYECGFFPSENFDQVCASGLTCKPTSGSKEVDGYAHEGARPAACLPCGPEDRCAPAGERHEQQCLKEYKISGEACATVRVSAMVSGRGQASRNHTVQVTSYRSATAEATAKATAEASSTQNATATAPVQEPAEGGESEASATASATASASAAASASAKVEANHSAAAEETAHATKTASLHLEAVAQVTACVGLEEIKERLGLRDVPRIGPVLAEQIVATGDVVAFEHAYAQAVEDAVHTGAMNAQQAAETLAGELAAQEARLKAEAAARNSSGLAARDGAEAAAAEAAQKEAQAKAAEKAQAKATEKAEAEAQKQAQAAAEEKAAEAAKAAPEAEPEKEPEEKDKPEEEEEKPKEKKEEKEEPQEEEPQEEKPQEGEKEEKGGKEEPEAPADNFEDMQEQQRKAKEEAARAQQAVADVVTPKADEPAVKVPAEPTQPPLRKMSPKEGLP